MFKNGRKPRFSEHVESKECLCTKKVSNIRLVSPEIYWRTMSGLMRHDRMPVAPIHRVLTNVVMAEVETCFFLKRPRDARARVYENM